MGTGGGQKRRRVLIWSDSETWIPEFQKALSDIVTPRVVHRMNDDPAVFSDLARAMLHQQQLDDEDDALPGLTVGEISGRVGSIWSHIRAFHGCRPIDVDSYHRSGLVPANLEALQKEARFLFQVERFPMVDESVFLQAVADVATDTRKGVTYFCLDERELLEVSSHYMVAGSEYLLAIAAQLERLTGQDFRTVLRERGDPTVFACDVPTAIVDGETLFHLSCELLEEFCRQTAQQVRSQPEMIFFGFSIRQPLSPDLIRGHLHPSVLRDPHSGGQLRRTTSISCRACSRSRARDR